MKAMILAAGLGTRLKPLTETTPKALLLINGKPLISYQIRMLAHHNFRDIVINLHWLGDLIEKELGSGSSYGVKITYSYEEAILGTAGGIKKAAPLFQREPLIVMNSDIVIDVDLRRLVQWHNQKKGWATLVLRPLEPGEPYTPIRIDSRKRITDIGTPTAGDSKNETQFLFTGVQILDPKLLDVLPTSTPSGIIKDGIGPAVRQGKPIYGFQYQGYFQDVGTMERYREADSAISSGRVRLSYL